MHSGSADAGHYYSYIKDRESKDRWLEFNDTHVRAFDHKNIGSECYGGNSEDFNSVNNNRFFERSRNAYLLFYERVNPISFKTSS